MKRGGSKRLDWLTILVVAGAIAFIPAVIGFYFLITRPADPVEVKAVDKSASAILEEIQNLYGNHRQIRRDTYVGLRFTWRVSLVAPVGRSIRGDFFLRTKGATLMVYYDVDPKAFPLLEVLDSGDSVLMTGRIVKVTPGYIVVEMDSLDRTK